MPELNLDNAAIFHEVTGSGNPPVVLVHGGMCDHRDWDRLVPLLAGQHTVVRFDLPGHGRSRGDRAGYTVEGWAGDLLALTAALGLERPVLVGHSLASRIVAEAAASTPEDVGGVVLFDGSRSHGGYSAPPPAVSRSPASLDAIIEATIGPYADAVARGAIHARMAAAPPEIIAACVTALRDWDLGRADAVFAALAGSTPVLAIQSTYHDQATPRRSFADPEESSPYLDFLRDAVPQLDIAILPHAGHFTMLERPEAVAGLIHDFAARVRKTEQETGDTR